MSDSKDLLETKRKLEIIKDLIDDALVRVDRLRSACLRIPLDAEIEKILPLLKARYRKHAVEIYHIILDYGDDSAEVALQLKKAGIVAKSTYHLDLEFWRPIWDYLKIKPR